MADKRRKQSKASDRSEAGNSQKSATQQTGTIHTFIGMLAGKTKKVATIEEINEAAADGWAGLPGKSDGKVSDKKKMSRR